ncbi:FAD-binding oxidoreductase [Burkholderia gladioli]|uniref:FAD-binding oxidoreductase n=1 Tax=Burkholderia gladioli TaxID=28095 RepID=UPI001640325C|nr:FAD-binding oxidoreductase [Burkholderia gladioli]MBU9192164.1 FAD-binding oxidoreductase [Burkholderia gladioli]MDN7810013.1 FAD-binding oxidoreductase [Burkholderia gladioli]
MSSTTMPLAATAGDAFAAELRDTLGPGALLHGEAAGPHLVDVLGYTGRAAAVVLPRDTAEVAAVLGAASRHGVRLVPQGNRTGLVGGALPDGSGRQVALSLSRMRRLRELDPLNRSVTVEAGMALSELNRTAAAHRLQLPVDLGSDPSIGGLIGANAGGSRLLKYGDTRRNVLGLEVVVPDAHGGPGRVLDLLRPLRKHNAGVDLKQLFIGTGGAFGVITAASVALQRAEQSTDTTFIALPDYAAASRVLDAFEQDFGDLLCAFEVMSSASLEAVTEAFPALRHPLPAPFAQCYALVEVASAMPGLDSLLAERRDALLARLHADGLVLDAAPGHTEAFWRLRDALPEAIARQGAVLSFDVSFPRSRLAAFREHVVDWLRRAHPLLRVYDFGHFGDGGCHLVVSIPSAHAAAYGIARTVQLRGALYELAARHDGCFSAEHGVGPLNAAFYRKHVDAAAQALAAGLQTATDPLAVLGRFRYG